MQIVLVSHIGIASGMISAVNFVIGKNNAFYAELDEHGIEKFKQKINELISKMDAKDKVVLISDIPAGSPGNTALAVLNFNGFDVEYISGMNLGMLLELFLGQNVEKSITAGVESIQKFTDGDIDESEDEF